VGVDQHWHAGLTECADQPVDAGGVVEMAMAAHDGLNRAGVDVEAAHVLDHAVRAGASVVEQPTQLEATTPEDITSAAIYTLQLLARRILALTGEIDDLVHWITDTISLHCPTLLTRRGVGPDNAAVLLLAAGDNPDRLRSETSFAALCGINPLEASSGKTNRRRLNRSGDRQANSALYRIALSRLRWDTRTRHYLTRCITEGKTRREAIRCLKRYIAREIYQIITSPPEVEPSAA